MEEVYNLHQYSHCASLVLTDGIIDSSLMPRSVGIPMTLERQDWKDHFFYNTQTKKIQYMDNQEYNDNLDSEQLLESEEFRDGGWVHFSNCVDVLYQVFKKEKKNWDDKDKLFQQAVSKFIHFIVRYLIERCNTQLFREMEALHYVCVIPSEWDYKMRAEVLRPVFVKSGLISENDHKDRLFFLTTTDAMFYSFQTIISVRLSTPTNNSSYFRMGEHRIMCNLNPLNNNTVSVELKLIETQLCPFDIPDPLLYPRVINSTVHLFEDSSIKKNVSYLLKHKLFPKKGNHEEDALIRVIVEDVYDSIGPKMKIFNHERDISIFTTPCIAVKGIWLLDKLQLTYLNSLSIFDICQMLNKDILQAMKNLLSNSCRKECSFFLVPTLYLLEDSLDFTRTAWIQAILESCKYSLADTITRIDRTEVYNFSILDFLLDGACFFTTDTVRNSSICSPPYLIPQEATDLSSSIFLNSQPNAILNIDISLASTSISYTLMSKDGLIEKVLDNCFFITTEHIPPLKHFFQSSDDATLNVKEKFIQLAEKYLKNQSVVNDLPFDDQLIIQFGDILNNQPNEIMASAQQVKYIKVFMIGYLAHIKKSIECKLHNNHLETGYLINVENILLNRIVGTKEDLKDLVYQSGLLQMNDALKKLRISTQGQSLLPLFQKEWQLNIPIKSYFVLAQLHEDYVQLTLNQVVTDFNLKEGGEQESIILQEEIIPIENVYDSLCTHMWNNILNNTSMIDLCNVHCKYNDFMLLELFSFRTRIKFMNSLKLFILNKILSVDASFHFDDKQRIPLNSTCKCGIDLSVRNIIDISFQPVLHEIAVLVTASLVDKSLFGNYTNIGFIFYVIYFNNSSKFQIILGSILNDEGRDVEARCLILPELPNQLLRPIVHQRSLASKGFYRGELYQVSNENYGFHFSYKETNQSEITTAPFYKDRMSDEESCDSDDVVFLLLKKGAIISHDMKRIVYLKVTDKMKNGTLGIYLHKILTLEGIKANKTINFESHNMEYWCNLEIDFSSRNVPNGSYVPIMVSVKPKFYHSSLEFSARLVGEEDIPDGFSLYVKSYKKGLIDVDERGREVVVPLYLARF